MRSVDHRFRSLVGSRVLTVAATLALAPSAGAQLVPLTELAAPYLEVGEPGLYPGGANEPTGEALARALARAAAVVPRDATGAPAEGGWIGFVAVGMSNTNQEWSRFERESDRDGGHAARVVLVDAAQGGKDAFAMDEESDPYWALFDQRLATAGVDPDQVQVVWLKQSVAGEQLVGDFPERMQPLRDGLGAVVDLLAARCANLQLVLASSRIWSSGSRRTFAYETAFAAKGLVADRLALPPEAGPWVGWGPYLWADGANPRADGLTWEPWDLEDDGVHPGPTAEWTVAQALASHLVANAWTAPWYRGEGDATLLALDAAADAHVDPAVPDGTFGLEPLLRLDGARRVYARFDLAAVEAPLLRAKLSFLADPEAGLPPTDAFAVAPEAWSEATIAWNNAPTPLLPALARVSTFSRGGAWALDVTAHVAAALAAGADAISFALATPAPVVGPRAALAREAGEPPRLVLALGAPRPREPIFVGRFESGDTWPWLTSP